VAAEAVDSRRIRHTRFTIRAGLLALRLPATGVVAWDRVSSRSRIPNIRSISRRKAHSHRSESGVRRQCLPATGVVAWDRVSSRSRSRSTRSCCRRICRRKFRLQRAVVVNRPGLTGKPDGLRRLVGSWSASLLRPNHIRHRRRHNWNLRGGDAEPPRRCEAATFQDMRRRFTSQ
jgi:hypothetical protein